KRVIVIPAGRAFDCRKSLAAVRGTIDGDVRQVDGVGILGIDSDFAEVPQPPPDSWIGSNQGPCLPGIVGAEEAAFFRVDQCVHPLSVGSASDGQANTSPVAARQSATCDLLPTGTAVGGLVDSARSRGRSIGAPRRTLIMHKRGVEGPG